MKQFYAMSLFLACQITMNCLAMEDELSQLMRNSSISTHSVQLAEQTRRIQDQLDKIDQLVRDKRFRNAAKLLANDKLQHDILHCPLLLPRYLSAQIRIKKINS